MKSLILLLTLCTITFSLQAQPGDMHRDIFLGFYEPTGQAIDLANTRYPVSFTDPLSGKNVKYQYRDKKFILSLDYGEEVKVNISDLVLGTAMVVYAEESLDSIVFQPGEFKFDRFQAFLFNVQPVNATIVNQSMMDLRLDKGNNQPVKFPLFSEEEAEEEQHTESNACYRMAAEMEKKHGGKNWIRNICNDVFEEYLHSQDTAIQQRISSIEGKRNAQVWTTIYPYKQQTFIRLDFYHEKEFEHIISISTDGCQSWKTLFRIKKEWYVHLLYFPGSDQVGIDISNSGVVLLSQNGFLTWKAYLQDQSEESPVAKTEALCLKNANWSDDTLIRFYFSE